MGFARSSSTHFNQIVGLTHETGIGELLNPGFGQLKPINKPLTVLMLLLT